jgi:hypothetical protein
MPAQQPRGLPRLSRRTLSGGELDDRGSSSANTPAR